MPPEMPSTRAVIWATIWDRPVRVVHWAIVLLIPFAWWCYQHDHMDWHRLAGYAVLALMAFRLFWGVAGSDTARFAQFLKGPGAIGRYLRGRWPKAVGHNPIGGWSVMLLLALLIVQPALGLFAADDNGLDSGPFADWVSFERQLQAEHFHMLLFWTLVGVVALHVCAILFYRLRGEPLVWAMVSGRGKLPPGIEAPRHAPLWRLAVGIALGGAAFWALYKYGG
jgi:cytochrome b